MLVVLTAGCGTTRTSDTSRTATEQLLISHSIDDYRLASRCSHARRETRLSRCAVPRQGITDKGYLISSLRQQLLACGCLLQEERKNATYVVEARAGSVGTDSNGMLLGVPQMSVPAVMPGIPGVMIPEIALAKKSNRRAVAKVAVFAYNRISGEPIWQSGTVEATSRQRNSWVCGAGPFQRGSLHRGTEFDEQRIVVPLLDRQGRDPNYAVVGVTDPAIWKSGPLPDDDVETAKAKAANPKGASAAETRIIQASNQSSHQNVAEKSE